MDASETSKVFISISERVISKTRSDLVSSGKLKLSHLNEIHATWKRKMIQSGIISGTMETSSGSKPVTTVHDDDPLQTQDPTALPVYAESGIDIEAQIPSMELEMSKMNVHGESGIDTDALFPSTELEMFTKNDHEGFYIPQEDGSGDGVDAADIKPNTNAPFDEDDEELNENDDVEEGEGGIIDDDNIPNSIVCQFDHVSKKKKTKKTTTKWDCKFKSGVVHINGKNTIFSEAKGDFDF